MQTPFRNLIPPLAPEELAQLETNIVADGCRDPLVLWGDILIDGHNRYDICQRNGLPFKTEQMDFADEDAAQVWIIRNQFGRRNLSAYARVELVLKLEPLLRKEAKERQREHGGTAPGKKTLPQKSAEVNETRLELAKAAHVSHDTIAKGKVIEAKASEEVKAALRAGESSINAEYKKLTVHVGHNSGENEWYTPAEFLDAARKAMGSITCDPASSEVANRTVKADTFYTAENDGLKQKWTGNVWLNPPYAQPLVAQFSEAVCEKLESKEIKQAVVLVNNATETAWFQRMLTAAAAVCFVKGRIKFIDQAGKPSGAPLQGQAILCLGGDRYRFRKAFASLGPVLFNEPV